MGSRPKLVGSEGGGLQGLNLWEAAVELQIEGACREKEQNDGPGSKKAAPSDESFLRGGGKALLKGGKGVYWVGRGVGD